MHARNIFTVLLCLFFCLFLLLTISGCGDDESGDDSTDSAEEMPADDDVDDDQGDDADDDVDDDLNDDVDDDIPWPYSPADATGPYAVGVETRYFVDESRYEIWGNNRRVLSTEIWYPSNGVGGTPNDMFSMVGEIPPWAMPVFENIYGEGADDLFSITTSAYRGAEITDQIDEFPVIIFSHGHMAVRFQNYTLCEYLASHGFVVLAPDHYGNAIFANSPQTGIVLFNPLSIVSSYIDRTLDIDFVVKELRLMDAKEDSRWQGRLDMEKLGLSGHSYGGLTAMLAVSRYEYIKAVAPLNPAWIGYFPKTFNRAFFMIQSDRDDIIGAAMNDGIKFVYEKIESVNKARILLLNAGHYNATDACGLFPEMLLGPSIGCDGGMLDPVVANEITCSYLTAFFLSALNDDIRYNDYLTTNHFPEFIEYSSVWENLTK